MQHRYRNTSGQSSDSLDRVAVRPAIFDDRLFDVWIDDRPLVQEVSERDALKIAHRVKHSIIVSGRVPRQFSAAVRS